VVCRLTQGPQCTQTAKHVRAGAEDEVQPHFVLAAEPLSADI
jgi:hypothetical protein